MKDSTFPHMSTRTPLDLNAELRRARTKFPKNDRLFLALSEEVGELAKSILETSNWREEALHIACVAIRIYEEGMAEIESETTNGNPA